MSSNKQVFLETLSELTLIPFVVKVGIIPTHFSHVKNLSDFHKTIQLIIV